MFLRPQLAHRFPHLTIGQSLRTGGQSPYPANSLNLGLYTDDNPQLVAQNRQRFAASIGWSPDQFAGAHQVHGAEIRLLTAPGEYAGYDALITEQPNILLTITTADCIPVLIYDPVNEAYGAAHAGWKGTVAEIAAKTLLRMKSEFQTKPADCYAYLAAGIGPCYFEVQKDVAQYFSDDLLRPGPKAGKYFVDLPLANKRQLIATGLVEERIEVSDHCTVAQNDLYFSYRAEGGKIGRMLSFIGRKI